MIKESSRTAESSGIKGARRRGVHQNGRVPKRGTVSVVGQGRAEGEPDVCRVTLTVTALRAGVAAALADSESAARRVRDALAAHGVAPRDAATAGVSVRSEEEYGQSGRRLLGYRAEHRLAVVLRDLGSAGRALGDAVAAGGDDVRLEGVEFTVDDDAPLRTTARDAAWHDALAAATQLAGLAGRSLGAVRSIGVAGGGMPQPLPKGRMLAAMSAGGPEVGLEAGAVAVHVSLAVVWELADA